MKTKLLKISKKTAAILLITVFSLAGIVACGGNSNITGSVTSTSTAPEEKKINSNLPIWDASYKPELPKATDTFYVVRYSSSGGSRLDKATMRYIASTENLQIYAEERYNVSRANITRVATKFENHYKEITNIYGTHTDMDKNGKVILLFADINGNNNSGVIATGYFFPSDLVYGRANNGEFLYMDINLLNSNPQEIESTVLHELQHLINFNMNYIKKGRSMSLWLDESLAESTAVLFHNNSLQERIKEFNTISYYCFYTWNLPSSFGFVNYPSAAVFMNWLYIKNGRNANIFKSIASSTQAQDYNKVLSAVSGNNWENLLTDWISGVRSGQVSGAYIRSRSSATLYPGALIYDGSRIRVNPSTELSNPSSAAITVSRENTIMGRNAINEDEEIDLQNNSGPKYIDLSFGLDGEIRKY